MKVFKDRKEIRGGINISGEYELKNNMTLKDLIIEAGGIDGTIERFRADISRYNYSLVKTNMKNI